MEPRIDDTEFQDEQEDRLASIAAAIETAVMGVIVARIGKIDDGIDYVKSREWLSADMAKIAKILKNGAELLKGQSSALLDVMARINDEWASAFYEAAGVNQSPVDENQFTSHILNSGKKSNDANIDWMTKTSVLRVQTPRGEWVPISQAYKSICDDAISAIREGTNYTKAITEAVRKMSKTGVRVEYASGARRELYSAASMNIMDGYRSTMQAIRDRQAVEFGADGVEVSAHSMCAPDHQPYQGRQYSTDEFEAIQKKLKRPIGQGYNCRHTVTKIKLGVSGKAYSSNELKEINKRSNQPITFTDMNGRERTVTAYEFTQYQRQVETAIRKQRMAAELLKRGGDTEGARQAEKDARSMVMRYNKMSAGAGIQTRPERTRVYNWNGRG